MATSVHGLEFSMISPEEAGAGEEFETILEASTEDIYDVKIFVYFGDKDNFKSQIYDGSAWKNPRLYLKGVFPSQETFRIKINDDFQGNTEICARMRKVNASSYSEKCNPINIGEQAVQNVQNTQQNNVEEDNEEIEQPVFVPLIEEDTGENTDIKGEKIVLKRDKEDKEDIFMTEKEKVRMWIIYAFSALCVFLIVLLVLRKL